MITNIAIHRCSQLLVGLPDTGKSTFLAALYHQVEGGDIKGSLVLERLGSDIEYLNRIREDWLKCEKISRATGVKSKKGTMLLRDPNTSLLSEVTIPDLLGEIFDHQFEERRWTHEFEEMVISCNGLVVFIHPDKVTPVRSIMEANVVVEMVEEKDSLNAPLVTWTAKGAATQIKLVDILRFILDGTAEDKVIPVAIVISAWDRVLSLPKELQAETPKDWVEKETAFVEPVLGFKLREVLFVDYFGISAQGGDYTKDKANFLGEASKRVLVYSDTGAYDKDISAPIKWVMSLVPLEERGK